jgi:hypothetical protein
MFGNGWADRASDGWRRVWKLQRGYYVPGWCRCDYQLDAICERLVGRYGTILRDERDIAVAVLGAAGNLGGRAMANAVDAGER